MKTKEVVVRSEHGLHLRVAGQIVKVAAEHDCRVKLSCDGCRHADACSVMQLLMLGAAHGSRVKVQADGPDEDAVVKLLADLCQDGAGI